MKEYDKQHCLFLIFILMLSCLITVTNSVKNYQLEKIVQEKSPLDILEFTQRSELDKKLKIDIADVDPLNYMKIQKEIENLYMKNEVEEDNRYKLQKSLRFKERVIRDKNQQSFKHNENINFEKFERFSQSSVAEGFLSLDNPKTTEINKNQNSNSKKLPSTLSDLTIKPYNIGVMGIPMKKEYNSHEENVEINNVIAESNYIRYGKNKEIQEKFDAKNVLSGENFWCSAGNHELKEEVKFFIELKKSFFISSMWIYWAFAPGEYNIKYSNDKKIWTDLFGGFKLSVKGGNMNWWKSVLSDAKKRWEYRSFDERINFDEPFFGKYIEITMRIPVNQYFGLYKIEFYTRSKSIVMIKSKSPGTHLCLATSNGQMTNYSPIWAIDCLQAISYGDNREIWILQSNGFITTYNDKKCMESPSYGKVDIIDCGKSSDFKDDRDKWILDYDGKIRSSKEKFTCLSMVDSSFGDIFSDINNLKVSASSSQSDGNHNAEQAIDKNSLFYWASNPSLNEVIFEIYFPKYSIFLKNFNINWKFPAKKFKVLGLLPDGYWKTFFKTSKNRDTNVNINFMNYDIVGIKILMQDSTTKIENKNIYGIEMININTGARFLKREPCQDMIGDINKWEIIYSHNIDEVTGKDYKKAWAEMHITRNKFNLVKNFYVTIPENLVKFKENSIKIKKKVSDMDAKFGVLENRLMKFEDILTKEKSNKNTIGSNEFTPAYDCSHIIRSFPSKRSGFYYLKNECMSKAKRVYCDFDSYDKKNGLDYLIFTNGEVINSPIRGVKNLYDVRLMCNKIGLEPIEIKNSKMLGIIIKLLKKSKFDFGYKNVIPLGYDYSCDVANCSKIYRSFNDIKSGDLNDIFKIYEKNSKSSPISDIFEKNEADPDSVVNMSGVGKNMQIVNKKLSTSTIVGFVCSTNKDGSKSSNSYINIECDSNIRGEKWSKLELFSHVKFVCPRDCSLIKASVYGTDIYTDNSSICRAAVHSGSINDAEGGIIELTVHKGQKNYIGSSAHNVETLDYPQEWDRSFKVAKFKPYCAIDKIKDYANSHGISSFVAFEENENLQNFGKINMNLNNFKLSQYENGKIPDDVDLSKRPDYNSINMRKKYEKNESIMNKNFVNSRISDEISRNNLKNRKIGDFFNESLPEFKEVNSNITVNKQINDFLNDDHKQLINKNQSNDFVNSEKFKIISEFLKYLNKKNPPKNSQEIFKENPDNISKELNLSKSENFPKFKEESTINTSEENFLLAENYKSLLLSQSTKQPSQEFTMTTEDALISITSINSKDFKSIDLMNKFSNAFKSMVGQAASGVQILLTDKLIGLKTLKKLLKNKENKLSKLKKILFDIDIKSQQILRRIEHIGRKLRAKINKMNRRTDFVEDYNSKSIDEKYQIFNSLTGKGQPAKWDYYLYNLDGHFKTISQKGSFIDGRSGSHLVIKYRDFYDFEARFSILINDDNTFGVGFRYIDSFNYYIFEISNQGKGFKRIRKFLHGNPSTIDVKYDGGYVKNTWYNIKIRAQNSKFRIFMTTDNSVNMEKRYDLVFEFTDNELIHGTLAFASYGISSLLIDNISIVHIKCTNFNENPNKIQLAETSNCSRHAENFNSDYVKRWKRIDPLENLNGPSDWKIFREVDNRHNVLGQITNIQGLSMYEEGSVFLLNLEDKLCKKGKINIKFKSMDEGIVGIVFKYSPKGDFYILEVSGETESFVRIRKKINHKFTLIGIKQLLGFDINKWTRLILKIDGNKFNAYITKGDISNELIKVFDEDLSDNDLENGKFGISSYKNKVYFDEVFSSSFKDTETEIDERLYIDRENLPIPKNHISNKNIYEKLNQNIPNYSWGKCLVYSNRDDRFKHCQLITHTEVDNDKCKANYCDHCCNISTSIFNNQLNYLCKKQCNTLESPSDNNKSYKNCYEPKDNDSSIYPICEKQFDSNLDFYKQTRCKNDMCNLCCASFEFISKTKMSRIALNNCYKGCLEKFDKIDNVNKK